jgi:alanine racemase
MTHRPIHSTILTHNLCHNLSIVKKLTNNRAIWAVIKANAYGHTLEAALKGFAESEGLAILEIDKVSTIRKMGWTKKVLLLEGAFSTEDYSEFDHQACDFVIHQENQVIWLESYCDRLSHHQLDKFKKSSQIWLKLNTGMNRLGFEPTAYLKAYEQLKNNGFTVNHMTHFANADEIDLSPTVAQQWALFEKVTSTLPGLRSAANSAAVLMHPQVHADFCRPGIMLYGASPSGRLIDIAESGLKAGMSLRTQVIAIQNLVEGEQVGYGSQFTSERPSRIAVIACGYADGYPRHAPNGTPVWIESSQNPREGRIAGIAGRVSMDMITVDITDIAGVEIGTKVELWGENLPIDSVAQMAGTVGYELMCALAPRVPVIIS